MENPLMLEIFREAISFFRLKKYHSKATGSDRAATKKTGDLQILYFQTSTLVFLHPDCSIFVLTISSA